jgi:hypothetical protein
VAAALKRRAAMRIRHRLPAAGLCAVALCALLFAGPGNAQQAFRCTSPEGKVTYQETPCPKTSDERKVDTTPANTDFDPAARDKLLKQGEDAGKRLEARAAQEEAERRRRAEERAREEQREREAQAREEARDVPAYVYVPPGHRPPSSPWPTPPRPLPRPGPTPQPGR